MCVHPQHAHVAGLVVGVVIDVVVVVVVADVRLGVAEHGAEADGVIAADGDAHAPGLDDLAHLVRKLSRKNIGWGRYSTEVAFRLLIQQARVRLTRDILAY